MQITLELSTVIELALGAELKGVRELPDYESGVIINELVKDGTTYKIQFESFDGTPLKYPKLWSYSEWYDSSTNYKRQKVRAENERIARRILEANVKIVSKHLINEFFFEEEKARVSAYNLLSSGKIGNIRAMGIKHLVTKEEELK